MTWWPLWSLSPHQAKQKIRTSTKVETVTVQTRQQIGTLINGVKEAEAVRLDAVGQDLLEAAAEEADPEVGLQTEDVAPEAGTVKEVETTGVPDVIQGQGHVPDQEEEVAAEKGTEETGATVKISDPKWWKWKKATYPTSFLQRCLK